MEGAASAVYLVDYRAVLALLGGQWVVQEREACVGMELVVAAPLQGSEAIQGSERSQTPCVVD